MSIFAVFDTTQIDIEIVSELEDFIRKEHPEIKLGTGYDLENHSRDWFLESE